MSRKNIKINPNKNIKSNKNLILITALLIILVVVFAPKLIDLTGKTYDTSTTPPTYLGWTETGGSGARTRYVDTDGVSSSYETISITPTTYGNLRNSMDYDPVISYDGYVYFVTDNSINKLNPNTQVVAHNKIISSIRKIGINPVTKMLYAVGPWVRGHWYFIDIDDMQVKADYPSSDTNGAVYNHLAFSDNQIFTAWRYKSVTGGWGYTSIINIYDNQNSNTVTSNKSYHLRKEDSDPEVRLTAASTIDDRYIAFYHSSDPWSQWRDIYLIDQSDNTKTLYNTGCNSNSEMIVKEDYLYFLCGVQLKRLDISGTVSMGDISTYDKSALYKRNAFAISNDKIYIGNLNGDLNVLQLSDLAAVATITTLTNENEKITSIAVVKDLIYVGTDKGNIIALKTSDRTEAWRINVGTKPINSIIIPEEDTMLAVSAEDNKLFFFDTPLGAQEPPPTTCSSYTTVAQCNTAPEKCYWDVTCKNIPTCSDNEEQALCQASSLDCIWDGTDCSAFYCSNDPSCLTRYGNAKPWCNLLTGECVECKTGFCITGEVCDLTSYECKPECDPSATPSECSDPFPVCGPSNFCVECTANDECLNISGDPDPNQVCDQNKNICKDKCGTHGDCIATDPNLPMCGPSNFCVECLSNANCDTNIGQTCDTTTKTCIFQAAAVTCSPTGEKITATTYCDASGSIQNIKALSAICNYGYQCPGGVCYGTPKKCQHYDTLINVVCAWDGAGLTGNLQALYTNLCGA